MYGYTMFTMKDPRDPELRVEVSCDSEGPYTITDENGKLEHVADLPAELQKALRDQYDAECEIYWTLRHED